MMVTSNNKNEAIKMKLYTAFMYLLLQYIALILLIFTIYSPHIIKLQNGPHIFYCLTT